MLEAVRPVRASDVVVSLVHSEPEAREAVQTLARIWPRDDGKEPLPPELAWVFAHSGNYVAVARVGGTPVGAAIGFRGEDDAGLHLHSHIAGVLPEWQGSSVGYVLKQHQRSWALGEAIDRITWTFDPLVARNAYFNVVKLGAHLTRYYVDFYGPMDDGINDGDETDRCLATWRLTSAAAVAAAGGAFAPADVAAYRSADAVDLLAPDDEGRPVSLARVGDAGQQAVYLVVQLPQDIVAVRRGPDPTPAREWRVALRQVLVPAFEDGFEVVGVSRDSAYVLARPGA